MDFLFAPLPATNFQMTDFELVLWQRNALFECECDNFINQRLESSGRIIRRRSPVENAGIMAAIQQQGLFLRAGHENENTLNNESNSNNSNVEISAPPPAQRRRLGSTNTENERDNVLDNFFQEAIASAIRDRGLRLQNHSQL